MTAFINATTANGIVLTPDNSGNILLQYNGVAAPAFSAYCSSSVTILNSSSPFKIPFQTEIFDTANCYDNTTNYRFTPNVAGYYQINANVSTNSGIGSPNWVQAMIYKNGSTYVVGQSGYWTNTVWGAASVSDLIYMNGTTDYLEIYLQSSYTGGVGIQTSNNITKFSGCLLRGA